MTIAELCFEGTLELNEISVFVKEIIEKLEASDNAQEISEKIKSLIAFINETDNLQKIRLVYNLPEKYILSGGSTIEWSPVQAYDAFFTPGSKSQAPDFICNLIKILNKLTSVFHFDSPGALKGVRELNDNLIEYKREISNWHNGYSETVRTQELILRISNR